MSEKKYYWLKLKRDFFKRHDMQIIEAMPNGKDYVLFYLKLLVESVDHDGALRFSDTIPYNEQMLATITGTNIDVVRSAMKILTELRMMEVLDDQTVFMREVQKMVGCETSVAERMRKSRERKSQKALPSDTSVSQCYTQEEKRYTEIELEKELEKDSRSSGGFLSDAEMLALSSDLDATYDALLAIGFPDTQSDRDRCERIVADYSAEWAQEAIRRTGDAPASARCWRYVEAILKRWRADGQMDSAEKPKQEEPAFAMPRSFDG